MWPSSGHLAGKEAPALSEVIQSWATHCCAAMRPNGRPAGKAAPALSEAVHAYFSSASKTPRARSRRAKPSRSSASVMTSGGAQCTCGGRTKPIRPSWLKAFLKFAMGGGIGSPTCMGLSPVFGSCRSRQPKAPRARACLMQAYFSTRRLSSEIMTGWTFLLMWPRMSVSRKCFRQAYPQARATGCAWKVEPQPVGLLQKKSLIGCRMPTIDSGCHEPVRPLALVKMSGMTPSKCWNAKSSPVRPKPVITSSEIMRMPYLVHSERTPSM
mmetsp:Transcript_38975/g.123919  ORF Transcript_38975/g.123919 Transcript_38975/m.123919 type:complete len:269 (-) Transcript_38975:246-1052(-)